MAKAAKIQTPYADILPPLSTQEFEALTADIKAHGVRDAVILDEHGNVLDGNNRLKIDPKAPTRVIAGLSEAEKRAFVFRSNFVRRNLSPEQKAEVRKAMRETAIELKAENPKKWTQQKIATALGVTQQAVGYWLENGGSNTNSCNASNRSPDQTADDERSYFLADARLKLSRKETERVAAEVLDEDRTQKQVAADVGVSRERVGQIVRREKLRREQAEERQAAVEAVDAVVGNRRDAGVWVGDWRDLAPQIPDASVELIFTDPPYHKEAVEHYPALAAEAARVLVDGGSLVCYVGNGCLPRVLHMMSQVEGLRYYWACAVVHTGQKARMNRSGIVNGFKLLAWFIKGAERFDALRFVDDCVISEPDKDGHKWQQSEVECRAFIEALTGENGLVWDPFGGSGTTGAVAKSLGRRWILCEIDPQVAREAAARIKKQ